MSVHNRSQDSQSQAPSRSRKTLSNTLIGGALLLSLALNAMLFAREKNRIASTTAETKFEESAPQEVDLLAAELAAELENANVPSVHGELSAETPKIEAAPIEPGSAQTLVPAIRENDANQNEFALLPFDKDAVLADAENRIHDDFSIAPLMKERVGFWFDVYTKWNEHQRVIHHVRYPWIVYRVVDVTSIIEAKEPRRRWMRNEKADKFVASEAAKIRAAIQSVSKRKSIKKLNPYEQDVVSALKKLGGNVHAQALAALGETRVQMGQRNFFEEGLRISHRYLPEMERIFTAEKLPIELTRLPLVESSFNKFATSKDGAAGIWQFMNGTGAKFMMINGQIDERRSPFKATEAAARLLRENHLILYRKWPLALTAYNHGPSGVRKAVKTMGTTDLSQIVGKYRTKMFGFASSNFYSSFLAAVHAQAYNDRIWAGLQKEDSLKTYVVRLPRAYGVSSLMKITGVNKDKLLLYNPDLGKVVKARGVVPRGFRLHLPDAMRTRAEKLFAQNTGSNKRVARKGS